MSSYEVIFPICARAISLIYGPYWKRMGKQFRSRDVRAGKSLHLRNAASRDRVKKETKKERKRNPILAVAEELS